MEIKTSKEVAGIVGVRIERALSERNMTAAELAKKTGMSQQDISNYRHGRYAPRQSKLFLLAMALGVSPAWLMGMETDMYIKDELEYLWTQLSDTHKKQALDYMRFLVIQEVRE